MLCSLLHVIDLTGICVLQSLQQSHLASQQCITIDCRVGADVLAPMLSKRVLLVRHRLLEWAGRWLHCPLCEQAIASHGCMQCRARFSRCYQLSTSCARLCCSAANFELPQQPASAGQANWSHHRDDAGRRGTRRGHSYSQFDQTFGIAWCSNI